MLDRLTNSMGPSFDLELGGDPASEKRRLMGRKCRTDGEVWRRREALKSCATALAGSVAGERFTLRRALTVSLGVSAALAGGSWIAGALRGASSSSSPRFTSAMEFLNPPYVSLLECVPTDKVPVCPDPIIPSGGPGEAAPVALCTVLRDEPPRDVVEFVEHHLMMGVNKVYFFDHGSDVPMRDYMSLKPLFASGRVRYQYFTHTHGGKLAQLDVYDECLNKFAHKHEWIGALDIDEHVRINDGGTQILDVLRNYDIYGGLGVNWVMRGSSHLVFRPETGLLSEHYGECYPRQGDANHHVKTFVNTKWVNGTGRNMHYFLYHSGHYAVTTGLERVTGAVTKAVYDELMVVDHFVLRSLEDFYAKMHRAAKKAKPKTMSFFRGVNDASREFCPQLRDFERELRQRWWGLHGRGSLLSDKWMLWQGPRPSSAL